MSLADDILKIVDVQEKTIKIDAWGGRKITIRGLTAAERLLVTQRAEGKDSLEWPCQALVLAVRDPKTGERIFTEAHIPELRNRSAPVIDLIGNVILGLSSLTVKDREQAEKN